MHAVDEEEEGGEALHVVLLGEVGVLGGVDLGERDVEVLFDEVGGGGGVARGERLAVAAPGRVELDEDVAVGRQEGGEVGGGEEVDVGLVDLGVGGGGGVVGVGVEEVGVLLVVVGGALLEPALGVVGLEVAGIVDDVVEVVVLGGGGGEGGEGQEGGGGE